ncbi:hypothetical protein RUM44_001776 [Polyplax serrata]|uniref:Mitoferrin-1 n=1 Tax=Polyplax serrata TaxID=468196 RepID=A0ABR1AMH7_POLSC
MHDHSVENGGSAGVAVNAIAGGTAGIIELCVMYPIDTVKTRMQTLEGRKQGVLTTLKDMIKEEGILRPMRGVGVIAATAGPAHGIYFASYEFVKGQMSKKSSDYLAVAAGTAAVAATIAHDGFVNPAEVIKQRLQMENSPYRNIRECAIGVYKSEGLSAFYKSFGAQLAMNIPFQVIQFVTYEFCRRWSNPEGNIFIHFFNGGVAGSVAAVATTPLDVCKTLLNTQELKVSGMREAMSTVYKISGPAGFFKGTTARILYQAPSVALCWAIFETIGLMRGGRFLAEDSPDNLLNQYNTDTLEDVFLKLSVMQNMNKRRRSSFMQELIGPNGKESDSKISDNESEISGEFGDAIKDDTSVIGVVTTEPLPPDEDLDTTLCESLKFFKPNHMKALIWKNFLWMWRNVGMMLFISGLPVIECIIFCLCIGHDPKGLKFAVFNDELNHTTQSCETVHSGVMGDVYENLACLYLNKLGQRNIEFINTDSEMEAIGLVTKGHAWGALEFSKNYSEVLAERARQGRHATPELLDQSDIKVTMDMSDQQIGYLLRRDIYLAFVDFVEEIANQSNVTNRVALPPIQMKEPIYGDRFPNFTDFAAPGIILTVVFFLSVASTSGAILVERNEGLLERSLVLGITGHEILLGHLVTQFLLMLEQTFLVLIFTFGVFHLTLNGSILTIFFLVALTGLCGMTFGFMVACCCDNERSATYMALGSFLPIVMLCGIIWPIEGMHVSLKFVSLFLPLTKSTESLRSMLQRGWTFANPVVYTGFLSTLAWIGIFMSISVLALKFKKG